MSVIDVRTNGDLAEADRGVIELLVMMESEGKATEVGLTLTDPDMKYDTWEALGRFLGSLDRRSRWYIGDWIIAGDELFGEEAAQAIEDTQKTRYDEAERVTGLDHGTLMNIRSVCFKVARERRRKEVGFWIHAEVAPLEPDDQTTWLQRAIDEGWTRRQLREAIHDEKNPPVDDDEGNDGEGDPPEPRPLNISERIEEAARRVFHQGQTTSSGDTIVPREAWVQLAQALGEE